MPRMQRRHLLLGLAAASAAAALPARAAEFRELKWEELVPKDWDPLKDLQGMGLGAPEGSGLNDADPKAQAMLEKLREIWDKAPTVPAMDGRAVRLPGFVVPLDETPAGLTSFLLVPYFGACIHTPPPPANQIVHVHAKTPVKSRTMEAVWVRGKLRIERAASSMGTSGYRLDAVGVEPYVERR
ncbi:DUF3299 domain-containing protein [Rubrivivax albus]|uniref:DUF3299 domain-containing protein n=2 Tax=Rubrivivax albus TaxID=2499835 RepID=A0A3S2U4I8_9BURK|nr:DUF3299 domain-containing protein [Rubrivivax albus]